MVNIIAHVNIWDIYKGELFSLVWQHQLFISQKGALKISAFMIC